MSLRRSSLLLFALLAAPVSIACGAASDLTTTDGGTPDAGACVTVTASSYDQSCARDADCGAVPPGGERCDPCGGGAEYFLCDIAAVNVSAAAAYKAAIATALAPARHPTQPKECLIASCPMRRPAVCRAGQCVIAH